MLPLLLFLSLFIQQIISVSNFTGVYTTSIWKGDKLYVYESKDYEIKWCSLTIYHLQDGPVLELEQKRNTINLTNVDPYFAPQFVKLPPGLPNGRSDELWLLNGYWEEKVLPKGEMPEWGISQVVNENELKFDYSFIKKPEFDNFPQSGYGQIVVNSNDNPTLYVIGGVIYSEATKNQVYTNYFFKYEFKTSKWTDISHLSKSTLPPMAYHRIVEIDNMLVVMAGQGHNKTLTQPFGQTLETDITTHFYDLNVAFKFDLTAQKWEKVWTKLDFDVATWGRGSTSAPSLDVYNGTMLSYLSLYNLKDRKFYPKIGVLDQKTWTWKFIEIVNDIATDNSLMLMYHNTMIVNDQLILVHGMGNQNKFKTLFVIDLKINKIIPTLNYSGKYGLVSQPPPETQPTTGLPNWAIITIVVVCIIAIILLLIAIWLYFRYKRGVNKHGRSDQKMQEVWASNQDTELDLSNRILKFSNSGTAVNSTGTTANDESTTANPDYLKHEVDLQDLEDKKAFSAKV